MRLIKLSFIFGPFVMQNNTDMQPEARSSQRSFMNADRRTPYVERIKRTWRPHEGV